eukprot:3707795-Rhodomonas_salina.1
MDINIRSTKVEILSAIAASGQDKESPPIVSVFRDEFVQGDHYLCSLPPVMLDRNSSGRSWSLRQERR